MGLLAAGVCALGAVISMATFGAGTIIAGAMIGAAMGCLSSTLFEAEEELASGNLRDTKEIIRDLVVSGISGALTGAIGTKAFFRFFYRSYRKILGNFQRFQYVAGR